ncbi:LL-diaminopimelate aminotransferase, partial [Sarracenia purpurea var. burkii]
MSSLMNHLATSISSSSSSLLGQEPHFKIRPRTALLPVKNIRICKCVATSQTEKT